MFVQDNEEKERDVENGKLMLMMNLFGLKYGKGSIFLGFYRSCR